VMPGEKRGCVGCHESHSVTPAGGVAAAAAVRRDPSPIAPPPWGTRSLSYERLVQPVLDRHCGPCHQGDGKGRKKLDLTLRPGAGVFKEPYLSLIGPVGFDLKGAGGIAGALKCENYGQSDPESYTTTAPLAYLSPASRLVENAMSGRHHDVRLPADDLRLLIGWVDANCPYRGDEDIRDLPDPAFAGIEKLPIRPQVRSAPVIARP
ncbi:MAG: hypothetical protein IMZ55_01875, partial [Acidobacteria bacterium]|nr:hypothetical protein [Acidobacteriota bacterium]